MKMQIYQDKIEKEQIEKVLSGVNNPEEITRKSGLIIESCDRSRESSSPFNQLSSDKSSLRERLLQREPSALSQLEVLNKTGEEKKPNKKDSSRKRKKEKDDKET